MNSKEYEEFTTSIKEIRSVVGDLRYLSESIFCVLGDVPMRDRLQVLAQDLTMEVAKVEKLIQDSITRNFNESLEASSKTIKALTDSLNKVVRS